MQIILHGKSVSIDDDCVNMVAYFNAIGLKTKHSCCGHGVDPFSIIFENSVTDEQMENFISKFEEENGHSPFKGKFSKWLRKINERLVYTWVYECQTIREAKRDYYTFTSMEFRKCSAPDGEKQLARVR